MEESSIMKDGHIYSIFFGENVQLVARYYKTDACNHYFFTQLHYWNGHETFYDFSQRPYCVKDGITGIREATPCEKRTLRRFERREAMPAI